MLAGPICSCNLPSMTRRGPRFFATAAMAGLVLGVGAGAASAGGSATSPRSPGVAIAAPASSASPDPTFVVTGRVVDADGNPTFISSSYAIETFADGSYAEFSFDVEVDGSFLVALVRDGTPDSPITVVLQAWGTPADPITDDKGCWFTYAPYGEAKIDIPGTVPAEPVLVNLGAPRVLQGICPAETSLPLLQTLPPTDTDAMGPGSGAADASLGWAAVVGALFAVISACVIGVRFRPLGR